VIVTVGCWYMDFDWESVVNFTSSFEEKPMLGSRCLPPIRHLHILLGYIGYPISSRVC